ncbi:MAG TPA: helix-turn-helix transcriptional regulator [Longimicrobium sp.]|uniref:helix-turn-helix domain-containing protein n=1 Tax=Longimicrobium sp. TaxID=2029185 RepID=UPI002EDA0BCA
MRVDDFFDQLAQELPEVADAAPEVDPPFILAGNVYRTRTRLKLTQGQLAERIGVSQPRIAEIERGDANPRLDTLARIAHALGVSISRLLDGEAGDEPAIAVPSAGLQWGEAVEELESGSGAETALIAESDDELRAWAAHNIRNVRQVGVSRAVARGVVMRLDVFSATYAQHVR